MARQLPIACFHQGHANGVPKLTPKNQANKMPGEFPDLQPGLVQTPTDTCKPINMTTEFIPETDKLLSSLLIPVEYDSDEDDDPLADYDDGREAALDQLKPGALELASFENDVDHSPGLSWHTNLSIFVVPVPDVEGGFALLVLDWDDNWGRWEWRCEAALSGAGSRDAATAELLQKYKANYAGSASAAFLDFLDSLS